MNTTNKCGFKNAFKPENMVKAITRSKTIKIIFLAILVTSVLAATAAASSLGIDVEDQVKEVTSGGTAHFLVDVTNEGTETVDVSAEVIDSELSISFSPMPGTEFSLDPGETETIQLFATTTKEDRGTYDVPLYINGKERLLAVKVIEGMDSLELHGSYEEITVAQGSTQELKFVAENIGNERIKNIIISGDISTRLSPEYSDHFFLNPEEQRDASVTVEVPDDFPTGRYIYEVTAASGEKVGATEEVIVNVVDSPPVKGRLRLRDLRWRGLVEDDETVGYKVTFEIENRGLMDIQDVEWEVEGMPENWNVSGADTFDIDGGETIQKTLEFDTQGDFGRETVKLSLLKEDIEITDREIVFRGDEIGVGVGGLAIGGFAPIQLGIGALIGIIITLALYMRQTEGEGIVRKPRRDSDYLKRLVDETIEREVEKGKLSEEFSEKNKSDEEGKKRDSKGRYASEDEEN
ncbi:MAG: hypothetical protein ACOCTT_01065 [archaeon]